MDRPVPRALRKNIFDALTLEGVAFCGRLDDVAFLQRVFDDLDELPSNDSRFRTAGQDIWQHRVNNYDWDDDWIFHDERFNLLGCPEPALFQFLCEMVHPLVRSDQAEAEQVARLINDHLRPAGWALEPVSELGRGRSVYEVRPIGLSRGAIERGRQAVSKLSSAYIQRQLDRAYKAVNEDPELAIGTAKDLVESVCKSILAERGVPTSGAENLQKLANMTMKEIALLPGDVSDEKKGADEIRRILDGQIKAVQGMAGLRGLYGSGHGRVANFRGLQPRHAQLAVSAASTFIDFVVETHRSGPNSSSR